MSIINKAKTEKTSPSHQFSVENQQGAGVSINNDAIKNWWIKAMYKQAGNTINQEDIKPLWIYARDNLPWAAVVEGLYYICSPFVSRYCSARLLSQAGFYDLEDEVKRVVQMVFVRLFKKERRKDKYGKPIDEIIFYIIRIANNECFRLLKNRKKNNTLALEDERYIDERGSGGIQEKKYELLKQIITNEKNEKMRNICSMFHIDDMTYEQIAKVTEMSIEGVRKNVIRFQKKNEKKLRLLFSDDFEDLL